MAAAVYNPPGTDVPDVVLTAGGHLHAPPQNETLTYDLDGNLLPDDRFAYTGDAENRLVPAQTLDAASAAGAPKIKVTMACDHQSRRLGRTSSLWTNNAWQVVNASAFLHDGWNLISEQISNRQSAITNHYAWGLDLSGSLQGAGGIRGLMAEYPPDTSSLQPTVCFPCYDANSNVMQLASATDGVIVALYEHDPFGNTVIATGPMSLANLFRFSTKWWDDALALAYYGYRYYSPEMEGWLSRDPINELGFKLSATDESDFNADQENSLYRGLQNNPIVYFDRRFRVFLVAHASGHCNT